MSKYVFVFQGAAVFALGLALGWATYDFALTSGSILELIVAFFSLPLLYLGLSLFKEYEFSDDALVARQSFFREETRIPYDDISDVRLTYLKHDLTPPLYTLAIEHRGGTESVGFGFSINEGFLKALEDRVGRHKITRHA